MTEFYSSFSWLNSRVLCWSYHITWNLVKYYKMDGNFMLNPFYLKKQKQKNIQKQPDHLVRAAVLVLLKC